MKNVKVFNVEKMVEEIPEHNLTAYAHDKRLAILQGSKGVLVVTEEGVHYKYDSMEEAYRVDCCPNDGKMYMFPNCSFDAPIQDFIEHAEATEAPLGSFVRTFGQRLEENYRMLLKSIEEIGLDPEDYPRKAENSVN